MDDAARRTLAITIVNNRGGGADMAAKAQELYDWMTERGDVGEQAVMMANNQTSPQSGIDGMMAIAEANHKFMTGGK